MDQDTRYKNSDTGRAEITWKDAKKESGLEDPADVFEWLGDRGRPFSVYLHNNNYVVTRPIVIKQQLSIIGERGAKGGDKAIVKFKIDHNQYADGEHIFMHFKKGAPMLKDVQWEGETHKANNWKDGAIPKFAMYFGENSGSNRNMDINTTIDGCSFQNFRVPQPVSYTHLTLPTTVIV